MDCALCGIRTDVVDSRPILDGKKIRRRRVCSRCGLRFTTFEIRQDEAIGLDTLTVLARVTREIVHVLDTAANSLQEGESEIEMQDVREVSVPLSFTGRQFPSTSGAPRNEVLRDGNLIASLPFRWTEDIVQAIRLLITNMAAQGSIKPGRYVIRCTLDHTLMYSFDAGHDDSSQSE